MRLRNPLAGWLERRRNHADMAVFGCLLAGDIYVNDMWKRLGGGVSRVRLALARLEKQGLVWAAFVWQPGGPPRRRYGLTYTAIRYVHLHRLGQEELGHMSAEERKQIEDDERKRELYERIEAQIDAVRRRW